ncbi:hypothetical protein LEMLEM_LOCUS27674 [Lemmus lemmus]
MISSTHVPTRIPDWLTVSGSPEEATFAMTLQKRVMAQHKSPHHRRAHCALPTLDRGTVCA